MPILWELRSEVVERTKSPRLNQAGGFRLLGYLQSLAWAVTWHLLLEVV